MKFILNQEVTTVDEPVVTVARLAEIKCLPAFGIAIAVNNKVVRKSEWAERRLAEGDSVTIITAVCGG